MRPFCVNCVKSCGKFKVQVNGQDKTVKVPFKRINRKGDTIVQVMCHTSNEMKRVDVDFTCTEFEPPKKAKGE